jgi:hypothetical protein
LLLLLTREVGLTGTSARGILPFVHGYETTDVIMDAILHGELIGRGGMTGSGLLFVVVVVVVVVIVAAAVVVVVVIVVDLF